MLRAQERLYLAAIAHLEWEQLRNCESHFENNLEEISDRLLRPNPPYLIGELNLEIEHGGFVLSHNHLCSIELMVWMNLGEGGVIWRKNQSLEYRKTLDRVILPSREGLAIDQEAILIWILLIKECSM